MSFRCHFVSFGGGRKGYGSALRRLKKEIHQLDPDAYVWLFDETNVGSEIFGLDMNFSDFAKANPRGFGLWVWKPWVVLQVMEKARDGDIVFFLDAGCTVHTSDRSKLRYQSYIKHIRETGNLFFQQEFREYNWTKREVVEHFQLGLQDETSGQIISGIHAHLVNSDGFLIIRQWLQACTLDSGRLVRDVVSRVDEDNRFVEHRHDQSVLSCLVKRAGFSVVPDETFHFPKWNRDGDCFPFWATRKISGIPKWMGYYAPYSWPFVLKSKLTRKPLTKLLDPEYLAKL